LRTPLLVGFACQLFGPSKRRKYPRHAEVRTIALPGGPLRLVDRNFQAVFESRIPAVLGGVHSKIAKRIIRSSAPTRCSVRDETQRTGNGPRSKRRHRHHHAVRFKAQRSAVNSTTSQRSPFLSEAYTRWL